MTPTSTPDITPSTSGCSNNNRSQTLQSALSTAMNSDETLLASDDEVIFLGNDDVNLSFDMVSDTLVYSSVHIDYVVTDTYVETVQTESGSVFTQENTYVEEMPVTEDLPQATDSQEPTNNETFFENPRNVIESENSCSSQSSHKNILNANVTFKRLLENSEEEAGNGDGVFQDCLTEFWDTFFATRTCGTTPESSLMDVFFNYISPAEKDVLSEALQDFQNADMDEVLSVLSSHNCLVLPNENNLQKILEEIAHKEMVQQPAYIIKCWKPILQSIGETMTAEKLDKITENLQPKARHVAKSIKFPQTMSPSETVHEFT